MKSLLRIITCIALLGIQLQLLEAPVLAKKQKERYNRITVGSVEVKDWQKGIVKRYPNLNHYHWNPIYANVQGRGRVNPPRHTLKGANRAATIKRKPRKIGPKYIRYKPLAKRPASVYKKPRHIKPSNPKSKTRANLHSGYKHVKPQISGSDASRNLSPRVAYKKIAPQINVKPRKTPRRELRTSPSLSTKTTDINLNTKKVGGELKSEKVQAQLSTEELIPEVKSYKPYKTTTTYPYGVGSGSKTSTKVSGKINK